MEKSPLNFDSMDEFRTFVRHKLGERENLLADQFPMSETKLVRAGKECGRQFILHGPRSVRLTAIWAADKNDLLLYDARGERFEKMKLTVLPR